MTNAREIRMGRPQLHHQPELQLPRLLGHLPCPAVVFFAHLFESGGTL